MTDHKKPPRPKLNFCARSLSARWVKAIRMSNKVTAFSPYITKCAVTRALMEKGEQAALYTVVSAENYASGASKLSCLRSLLDAKVKVFHLDDLHAKILMTGDGSLLSIGSQNMTQGGTNNYEASAIFQDNPSLCAKTSQAVRIWMEEAKDVTDKVFDDLKLAVDKLRWNYRVLKKEADRAGRTMWDNWEENKRRKEEAERNNRSLPCSPRTPLLRQSSEIVTGTLVEKQPKKWSLETSIDQSYCCWIVDGSEVNLSQKRWYTCYNLDTGKVGKARVCRSRISFISETINRSKFFCYGDLSFHIWASSINVKNAGRHNLSLRFRHKEFDILCLGYFDGLSIKVELSSDQSYRKPTPQVLETVHRMIKAINTNEEHKQDEVLDIITKRLYRDKLVKTRRVDKYFLGSSSMTIISRLWLPAVFDDCNSNNAVVVFSTSKKN